MKHPRAVTRRSLLSRVAFTAALGMATDWRAVLAATKRRARTPSQTEGPFYPVRKPAVRGNDLIHGAIGTAEGKPLELVGRVLDVDSSPVPGARVEIWQADRRGIYRHPRAPNQGKEDPAFKGYGDSMADQSGRYSFLTIVPVPYTGRPPHIHVKVWVGEQNILTTQLYLKDHPENKRDGLLSMLLFRNSDQLMIDPQRASIGSGIEGHKATFDLVI